MQVVRRVWRRSGEHVRAGAIEGVKVDEAAAGRERHRGHLQQGRHSADRESCARHVVEPAQALGDGSRRLHVKPFGRAGRRGEPPGRACRTVPCAGATAATGLSWLGAEVRAHAAATGTSATFQTRMGTRWPSLWMYGSPSTIGATQIHEKPGRWRATPTITRAK